MCPAAFLQACQLVSSIYTLNRLKSGKLSSGPSHETVFSDDGAEGPRHVEDLEVIMTELIREKKMIGSQMPNCLMVQCRYSLKKSHLWTPGLAVRI